MTSTEPTTAAGLDPSDCPICGEWRDAPTADCANCGWSIRPCGDALGLCAYRGSHDGPHKFAGSWAARLRGEAAAATPSPLAVELAELYLAAAMQEAGFVYDTATAATILDYLRADNNAVLSAIGEET